MTSKTQMAQENNNNRQRRILILPLPLWGFYQAYQAVVAGVRYLRTRRRYNQVFKGNIATTSKKLFGTHTDPFCAEAAKLNWQLLNDYRKSLGLRPLVPNYELAAAARYMGKRMLQKNEFEHVLSDGVGLTDRTEHFGYRHAMVGENLASSWGIRMSAQALAVEWHQGWIASHGHHQNMIDPNWEEVGIAVVRSYSGTPTYYGVQNFGKPIK